MLRIAKTSYVLCLMRSFVKIKCVMNPYVHPPPSTRIIWLFLHGAFSHTPIPGMDINIVLFILINSMLTHKTHANHVNNIPTILTADSDHDNHLSCPWPSRTTPQSDKVPETSVCGKTWRGGIVVTKHVWVIIHIYCLSYILAITHIGYHI